MASDFLPGVYSRIGTEQDPGSFKSGGSIGGSMKMPPNIIKRWVLEYDKWNNRNYWLSGGVFSVPPVWLMKTGIWSSVGVWLKDGIWRMNRALFSTNNIWNNDFVWTKDLIWKL
jgi:hypothetical protein